MKLIKILSGIAIILLPYLCKSQTKAQIAIPPSKTITQDEELCASLFKYIEEWEENKKRKLTVSDSKVKWINKDHLFLEINDRVPEFDLLKSPNTWSPVIYSCPRESVIMILDYNNEYFYKIYIKGHTGYMPKAILQ